MILNAHSSEKRSSNHGNGIYDMLSSYDVTSKCEFCLLWNNSWKLANIDDACVKQSSPMSIKLSS